jgi:ribosomal protein S18 acetylase RimI-like enzyme
VSDEARIEFRRATPADAPLLERLYARFLESQFALMPGTPRNADFDLSRLVAFRLTDPATVVYLAFVDGEPAGFSDAVVRATGAAPPTSLLARLRRAAAVLLGRDVPVYLGYRSVGHLLNLWVEPAFRGLRLGEQLTSCRVNAMRAAGADFILGEVLTDNAASHRTVQATGAKPWATIYRWPTSGG